MLSKVVQRSALIALLALGSLGSVLAQKNEDYKSTQSQGEYREREGQFGSGMQTSGEPGS